MQRMKWQRDARLIALRRELRQAKTLLRDAADWLPASYNDDPDDAHPTSVRQRKIADRILKFLNQKERKNGDV